MRYLPLLLLLSLPALGQPDTAVKPVIYFDPDFSFAAQRQRADSLERENKRLSRENESQSVTIRGLASGEAKRQDNTALITGGVILGALIVIGSTLVKQ